MPREVLLGKLAHILDEPVDKQRLHDLRRTFEEVRWQLCRESIAGRRRDRVQADHHHALGAQRQRRLDRSVQPRAAIEVPAACPLGRLHVHGGKDCRDGP